uniref:Uncharacterized protein n=1 Tax=Marmota marmota marmota TaxID=9994 RepID=A0A8C5YSJ1_MARMA
QRAGDVAQAVVRSPDMRAARVRSLAPHTNKDVVLLNCWDYRCVPPCLAHSLFLFKRVSLLGSCYVIQADLKLLGSSDPPTLTPNLSIYLFIFTWLKW